MALPTRYACSLGAVSAYRSAVRQTFNVWPARPCRARAPPEEQLDLAAGDGTQPESKRTTWREVVVTTAGAADDHTADGDHARLSWCGSRGCIGHRRAVVVVDVAEAACSFPSLYPAPAEPDTSGAVGRPANPPAACAAQPNRRVAF